MDGIKLASLFAYQPNKLNYCGPDNAFNIFSNYWKDGTGKEKARELLEKFEALNPYLDVIAEMNGKDSYDHEVVEAYWIGNEFSDVSKENAIDLVKRLNKRGLTDSMSEKLVERINGLKNDIIPLTHFFHVVFIGVGEVTGNVPSILENMDKCRISWGKIYDINDSNLTVGYNKLKYEDDNYFLNEKEEKIEVNYDKNILKDLNVGDMVAIHWGNVVKKLNLEELKNLKTYTNKVIELISRP